MVDQQRYQVRFDWGLPGALAIAGDADVIVWVDAVDARPVPIDALPAGPAVVSTGLEGASAAAAWVLALQEARRARTFVAVVAAGAPRGDGLRFATEDLLAAGALLEELEARGIDAMSPEAATAVAAFGVLKPGVRSLLRLVVDGGDGEVGFEIVRRSAS